MRKYKLIFLALVCVFILTGLIIYVKHVTSLKGVTLSNKTNHQVSVHEGVFDTEEGPDIVLVKSITTLAPNQSETIKLKKNSSYIFKFTNEGDSKDYSPAQEDSKFTVFPDVSSHDFNPPFSETKLDLVLPMERDKIVKAVNDGYSSWMKYYEVGSVKLYDRGELAGVTLHPTSQYALSMDVLRIVMVKDGNNWVDATKIPSISISKSSLPKVPGAAISSIDKQK